MSNNKRLQSLIERTDSASRKLLDNPHSRELVEEYAVVKQELKESIVNMRKALEAIQESPESYQ